MYTTIIASKEQVEALLKKHIKPIIKKRFLLGKINIPRIISSDYSYDDEDKVGFVTLKTITGKTIEYQLIQDSVFHISFTGFGSIKYDVHYPKKLNKELDEILTDFGVKAKDNFWKGAKI